MIRRPLAALLAAASCLVAGCTSAAQDHRATDAAGGRASSTVDASSATTSPAPLTVPAGPRRLPTRARVYAPAPASHAPASHSPTSHPPTHSPPKPTTCCAPKPAPHRARGVPLPLPYGTGNALQVVTVTAPSEASTAATLQRWQRAGTGWQRVGPAVPAFVGSDGMSTHPSESTSATPEGSFTLTRAFGHDPNPGTALPYIQTTPADWWISQFGPLYNTFQRCASNCSFRQGDPNEHLYYETPYYNYAAVIDYNTRNSPTGVRQGAGSAFFLHVSVGQPTAGCVSIPVDSLVSVLRWLRPAAHPRIVIGVR